MTLWIAWRHPASWLGGGLLSLLALLPGPGIAGAGSLSGGGLHSLAAATNQPSGYSWGSNREGQVGATGTRNPRKYPLAWTPPVRPATAGPLTPAATHPPLKQVASGGRHSVALDEEGTVWTWGYNGHGELGDGTTQDRDAPAPVPGLREVIAVAAGATHSLAVTQDGQVWSWGNNDYRQLGQNRYRSEQSLTPAVVVVRIPGDDTRPDEFVPLTGVREVAASAAHSVALTAEGVLWAWGGNRFGQLGTGDTLDAATARQIPDVRAARMVAGGDETTPYTLIQTQEGRFFGWGNNAQCQLGESAWEQQTTPRSLPNLNGLGTVAGLAGGGAHGALVTTDGQVWTWGDNQHGQLGDGTSQRACTPLAVPGMTAVATVSTGAAHTLVTQVDGTVWAWGLNDEGQLGDGSADDRKTPAPVKNVCGVGRLNLQAAPLAACPLTVEVDPQSDGQGTVSGGGDYAAGATITLTATPSAGSRFVGWGPEPCADQFTMPTPALALICRARFVQVEATTFPLTVATTGAGQGTVTGSGNYAAGTTVTLSAEPEFGSVFTGWSPLPCADQFLTPAQPLTCTATFEPLPNVPLTVLTEGNGQGTVSGGGQYQVGETVTLTANPHQRDDFCILIWPPPSACLDSFFTGWSPAPCAAVFTMPAQPLTCTATFTTGSNPQVVALVQHYYQAILGRAADPDGQTYWEGEAARMQDLGIDLPEVFRVMAGQFFTSAEYRSKNTADTQYVTDLYHTFFQREPDDDGLTHWTGQLAAGLPRDIVLYEFLFSAEFTAYMQGQFGNSASRAEALAIVDFYRGLLGRLPDNEGFRYWLDRFQTAQCQGAAAVTAEVEAISRQFANSMESLNRHRTNSEYLQDLYNAFLRRGAEVSGFTYWLDRLDSGTLTREPARQAFIATPEFQGRVNQIIQQGCNRIPFIQVSAGAYHTCGVKSDGAIACWGDNEDGQAMPSTGIFIQVSAGYLYACGVKSDGAVACWGDNEDGQATPPAGAFTQVSAGYKHTCGLKNDGAVVCWGFDYYGQTTPPAGVFTQVSAGGDHTCGVKSDGAVACWGDNWAGQTTPPAGTFTQVSAGYLHACGVKSDGAVACWGDNSNRQATPPAGAFTQVSAGYKHTCGLKNDGAVVCWGFDYYGQTTPPAGVFTQVSAGGDHTCGVKSDGAVACWGDNWAGQATPPGGVFYVRLEVVLTGPGIVTSRPAGIECGTDCRWSYAHHTVVTLTATPADGAQFSHWSSACSGATPTCMVAMSNNQEVGAVFTGTASASYTQVSAGGAHTCGLESDGAVVCWGSNYVWGDFFSGQATPPAGIFTQVSAGGTHTCGLESDGWVVCWGWNDNGQATPPAEVFTQVSAGTAHTCGVKTDGAAACWGWNDNGQATPPAGTFTQVSAGLEHTCGVNSDGMVACWGSNGDGQATPPAGVFSQVSAGAYHTCGVKTNGAVVCWGFDYYGQATPPAGVFTQVSAGGTHTCGVKSDGTVACWGDNDDGQADRPAGTFTQVSAGDYHTCGVKSDGVVVCWGNNQYGQSTPP